VYNRYCTLTGTFENRIQETDIVEILTYPDPFLKKKAEGVTEFTEELRKTVADMLEQMYLYKGIGLASMQVGIPERLFVLDISSEKDNPIIIINPVITERSSSREPFEEGCLSVPGIRENIVRPEELHLKWQDIDGTEHEKDFGGLEARVIQHEFDHLNGTLFIDRLGYLKKILLKKHLRKLRGDA